MAEEEPQLVLSPEGDVELRRAGAAWVGDGPGGRATGDLRTVLVHCAADTVEPGWIDAVLAAIAEEHAQAQRRLNLVVERGSGWRYHATPSANRASIAEHGLDWRRMTRPGIASSPVAEWSGIFLGVDREAVSLFVDILACVPTDVWRVRVDGLWLEGDPGSSGGADTYWAIARQPIPASDLVLVERDVMPQPREGT